MSSVPIRKNASRHRLLEARRLVLLQRVQVVQPAQEEQVGGLLLHFQRIGNPAGPKHVLDLVDLGFDGDGNHVVDWRVAVTIGAERRNERKRARRREKYRASCRESRGKSKGESTYPL